jgi:hypothetical protein
MAVDTAVDRRLDPSLMVPPNLLYASGRSNLPSLWNAPNIQNTVHSSRRVE